MNGAGKAIADQIAECSNAQNHRGPQGPNEDIAICPACWWAPSWSLRPEGEQFGNHLADCSLPRRHSGYCVPGGNGHQAPEVMRG